MKIVDLFSKRQGRAEPDAQDVYRYDEVPHPLRVQIVHILRDSLGRDHGLHGKQGIVRQTWEFIYDALCREYGVFALSKRLSPPPYDEPVYDFMLSSGDLLRVLDTVELCFRAVDGLARHSYMYPLYVSISPDDAIAELNERLRQHQMGYRFEDGMLIRVDSDVLHREVVSPALRLLSNPAYAGPNEEFLKAHEHYRTGRYEECLNECLKALESTLKVICTRREWPYDQRDTAAKLLNTCFSRGLVPEFLQSEFAGLRSVLESGVPTARNIMAAHGRGAQPRSLPEHFVSHILHLTAAHILFLVRSEHSLGEP